MGRWPANVIFDEEASQQLDEMTGNSISKSGGMGGNYPGIWIGKKTMERGEHNDSGGASRFFYVAKASSSERNAGLEGMPLKNVAESNKWTDCDYRKGNGEVTAKGHQNNHPTVKPIRLMEYLLKLITPTNPNAIVLDPFAGSGTTIIAACNLGFNAIGIEKEQEYAEIAEKRLLHSQKQEKQMELF